MSLKLEIVWTATGKTNKAGMCCEGSRGTHAGSIFFSNINSICCIMLCGLNLGGGVMCFETFCG